MKKLASTLLSALLLFSLAACGGTPGAAGPAPTSTPTPTPGPSAPAGSSSPTGSRDETASGRVLVVYFSAQNHTEAVAQIIANHMGADIFELTPAQPYTEDDLNWRNDSSRVNAEHEDEALRDIELENATPDSWADYDTVFVGYPIWWGIAAWPMNNFIKTNDFTGKTVIPFCTSTSSGLGESGELLAGMAGTGDWQEGQRFSGNVSAGDVTEWLDGLGL